MHTHEYREYDSLKCFNEYERTICLLEKLSSQCNINGLQNFFEYSIAIHYYDILDALRIVGAFDMAEVLELCKYEVFGDIRVPIDDIDLLEKIINPEVNGEAIYPQPWKERLNKIDDESNIIRYAFEARQMLYALQCEDAGLLQANKTHHATPSSRSLAMRFYNYIINLVRHFRPRH